jgi:hypothetical protein
MPRRDLTTLFEPRRHAPVYRTIRAELDAVRDGRKAMAMELWPRDSIDDDPDHAELVQLAMARGLQVIHQADTRGGVPVIAVYALQPEHAWRIPALRALWQVFVAAEGSWSDGAEALEGHLLGYTDAQIAAWLARKRHERLGWRGTTIYLLMTAAQKRILVATGNRQLPADALAHGMTAISCDGTRVIKQHPPAWVARAKLALARIAIADNCRPNVRSRVHSARSRRACGTNAAFTSKIEFSAPRLALSQDRRVLAIVVRSRVLRHRRVRRAEVLMPRVKSPPASGGRPRSARCTANRRDRARVRRPRPRGRPRGVIGRRPRRHRHRVREPCVAGQIEPEGASRRDGLPDVRAGVNPAAFTNTRPSDKASAFAGSSLIAGNQRQRAGSSAAMRAPSPADQGVPVPDHRLPLSLIAPQAGSGSGSDRRVHRDPPREERFAALAQRLDLLDRPARQHAHAARDVVVLRQLEPVMRIARPEPADERGLPVVGRLLEDHDVGRGRGDRVDARAIAREPEVDVVGHDAEPRCTGCGMHGIWRGIAAARSGDKHAIAEE